MIRTEKIPSFVGGISDSEGEGIEYSASFIQQLNIHEDPSYVTLMPAPTKISASEVTGLVKAFDTGSPWDTNLYAYDSGGGIYKIDSSNNVTLDRAVSGNGAAGQGLKVFNDYLYYATSTTIGRKGLLDNSPSYSGTGLGDDFLSDGTFNLDQIQNTSATSNTYTLLNAISEGATNKCSITPTHDPIKEIDVYLASKGTGNLTLTVHDNNNRLIGSATVNNGSLVAGGNYQPFIFSTPLRVVLNAPYHFHLTSTTGDGTVNVLTSSDFSTVNFKEYFGILITDTNWHMMEELNGLIICNGNYLATWDEVNYNPNAITLDKGYSARAIWRQNEFVAVAAWKGTSIDGTQDGKLYLWDGIASTLITTANYSYPITEGLPNAGVNFKNRSFTVLGSSGNMYLGYEPFQRVQTLAVSSTNTTGLLARGKKIEVAPTSMTVWEDRVMFGMGYSTDDPNFPQGLYGFGNNSEKYPEVLTFDIIPSSGSFLDVTAHIGAVKAFGKDLYFGWQAGSNYGIDHVSKTANAVTSGKWQSLIFDNGDAQKTKIFLALVITFQALTSNQSVQPMYVTDRGSSFTLGTTVTGGSATTATQFINTRAKELQVGFILSSTDGSFPKVTSVYFEYNDCKEELDRS